MNAAGPHIRTLDLDSAHLTIEFEQSFIRVGADDVERSTPEKSGRLSGRLVLALDLLLILIFLPHRQAERRFCAVGNPARMPG